MEGDIADIIYLDFRKALNMESHYQMLRISFKKIVNISYFWTKL